MKKTITVFGLIAILVPGHVIANDGFAALGVGGITISKTDNIAIKSEILDISCDKIDVSYEFVNESSTDIDALVMFPLPPYPANFAESNIVAHGQPSGFSIRVNGKPVAYDTEVNAIQKGRNITQDLKAVGLDLNQIVTMPFDNTILNRNHELLIPENQIEALTKKGLVLDGAPEWDVHVTYVWKQKFPANSSVQVEHSYRPFIAQGTSGGYSSHAEPNDYCLTKEQLSQLDWLYENKKDLNVFEQVPGTNLKYILTTANSWKDGIRDFKLRIHTKAEDEIVGLCYPTEVKRVSPTTYEAHIQNFKPKAELSVYFGNAKKCDSHSDGEPPILESNVTKKH